MNTKKGFTLIELLIVITIIGILAVAFLPSLLGAPSKARDTQRIADVQKIAGVLTTDMIGDNLSSDNHCSTDEAANPVVNKWLGLNEADFGGTIPKDPLDDHSLTVDSKTCAPGYVYVNAPSPDYSFGIYAFLENDTGNIKCTVAANGTASILDADIVSISDGGQNCYAVLVQ